MSSAAAVRGPLTPGPSPRDAGRGEPNRRAHVLPLIVLLALAAPAFAQRDLKDIPPADPELERQALQLGEGLEINLYAADPLLAKPIQMNFDAQGRLWIATSETYPHIVPGQAANDKIIVLEDADRDGRADKTHVFADGLLIPTGIEPGSVDGGIGCYVANSTELLHFQDTDGDLKADERKTLLSGFGTEDTHHLLHTLRWGPDGRLYMNQSIYIHSHIETPYGVRRLNGGGIWQYDPRTHRLEIFARGWINAWGHAFDRWGNSFVTDGAGVEGINYAFPGAVYPTAPGAPRVLHGMNPGSPKYCGLEIISGRHWPDDWQGDLVTCDFRAHRVVRYKLSEQGSGYTARQLPDLIKTTHVAFRPIDVKLGPDGALYIADWYNPIIQHGEVDFRDPRRDHTHGRIWRVTVKGRPTTPVHDFTKLADGQLQNFLDEPEDYDRHRAKFEILQRMRASKADVAQANLAFDMVGTLKSWTNKNDYFRAEVLWIHHRQTGAAFYHDLLSTANPHLRSAAARVAGEGIAEHPDWVPAIAELAVDESPQVRLEAICALQRSATFAATAGALTALDKPLDENLDFALWQLCRERRAVWLPDVVAGTSPLFERPAHLEFALRAIDEPLIVPPLLKLLDGGRVADDRRDGLLTLIARLGGPQELAMIFRRVLEGPPADAALQRSLLTALADAATTRKVRPTGDLGRMSDLLEAEDDGVAAGAARLLGLWKVEAARAQLSRLAQSSKEPTARHLAAVAALGDLAGDASRQTLLDLAGPDHAPTLRQAAVTALVRFDSAAAAQQAVPLLATSGSDAAAIVNEFVTRPDAAAPLRAALAGAKLPPDAAKLAVRTATLAAKPDDALVAALRKAGGITGSGLQLSAEQVQQLVAEVKQRGNPQRGETIYLRKELGCTKCHAIGGAGGRVGPDLVSIGASAQVDYLVDSIVVPNKAVKEGFHTAIVELDDGRSLNGVKVRQTDKDLILRDAEDREVIIPLKSIENQSPGQSLMPAGLADNLTRDELIDLVRFLSELGKVGPYQLPPVPRVRRWETLTPTKEAYDVVRRQGIGAAAGGDARFVWQPQFARVDGTLPIESLPALAAVQNTFMSVPPYTVVRFQFETTTAGEATLAWNEIAGLQGWLDGKPLDLKPQTQVSVSAGRHTIVLVVDRKTRVAPLGCELVDAAAGTTLVTTP